MSRSAAKYRLMLMMRQQAPPRRVRMTSLNHNHHHHHPVPLLTRSCLLFRRRSSNMATTTVKATSIMRSNKTNHHRLSSSSSSAASTVLFQKNLLLLSSASCQRCGFLHDQTIRTMISRCAHSHSSTTTTMSRRSMSSQTETEDEKNQDDNGDNNDDDDVLTIQTVLENLSKYIDQERHQVGSLGKADYRVIKEGLNFVKEQQQHQPDATLINLTFDMIERLCIEISVNEKEEHLYWFAKPGWCNIFFEFWEEILSRGDKEIIKQPLVMLQQMHDMTILYRRFKYDRYVVLLMMDVVAKVTDPADAPQILEEILEFSQDEQFFHKPNQLDGDNALFNRVIQAWAVSGSPDAETCMTEHVKEMRDRDGKRRRQPNVHTYNTLLQFYAGQADRLQDVLLDMQDEQVSMNFRTMSLLVTGYCQAGEPELAEGILDDYMLNNAEYIHKYEASVFTEHAQCVLDAYESVAADAQDASSDEAKAIFMTKRGQSLRQRMQKLGYNIIMSDDIMDDSSSVETTNTITASASDDDDNADDDNSQKTTNEVGSDK